MAAQTNVPTLAHVSPEVDSLFNDADPLTVDFPNGARIKLTYARARVTSDILDPTSGDIHLLARALAGVLESIDLARHGVPIDPKDPMILTKLPLAALQLIMRKIIQDQDVSPNS